MASVNWGEIANATLSGPPLTASCHCGAVTLELPGTPTKINECICSLCDRYGAMWGYYPRHAVRITATEPGLRSYVRADKENGAKGDIGFYWCACCGCLTHWWGIGTSERRVGENALMAVNARMLPWKLTKDIERFSQER